MKKQQTLTYILGLLPSYLSLFCPAMWAAIIMSVGTGVGIYLTGAIQGESQEWQRERLREAWICHLLGLCVVVYVQKILSA